MNTYESLRKVYVGMNMINNNYEQNSPIVGLKALPGFAMASILKTAISANVKQPVIAKAINAGLENDTIFITVMDVSSNNWPSVVDTIMTPSGNKAFIISIPENLFGDIDIKQAAAVIYNIFIRMAQYDTDIMHNIDHQLFNAFYIDRNMDISAYDISVMLAALHMGNTLMRDWWPDNGSNVFIDYLKSIGYQDDALIGDIMKTLDAADAINGGTFSEAIILY